jgi:hypothetical protein
MQLLCADTIDTLGCNCYMRQTRQLCSAPSRCHCSSTYPLPLINVLLSIVALLRLITLKRYPLPLSAPTSPGSSFFRRMASSSSGTPFSSQFNKSRTPVALKPFVGVSSSSPSRLCSLAAGDVPSVALASDAALCADALLPLPRLLCSGERDIACPLERTESPI